LNSYLPDLKDSADIASLATSNFLEKYKTKIESEEQITIYFYIGAKFDFIKRRWFYTRNKRSVPANDWNNYNQSPYYPIMADQVAMYNIMRFSGTKIPVWNRPQKMSVSLFSSTQTQFIKKSPSQFDRVPFNQW